MRIFFNITSTSYHGDNYNLTIINLDLYKANVATWQQLGLMEVYAIKIDSYISDTNNHLVIPENLGNTVLVQLHCDWWQP
jgi:hypothetical protein